MGFLPGGAVVDPGPGCVGCPPDVVFVVPLPNDKFLSDIWCSYEARTVWLLSVLVVGASGERPLTEEYENFILALTLTSWCGAHARCWHNSMWDPRQRTENNFANLRQIGEYPPALQYFCQSARQSSRHPKTWRWEMELKGESGIFWNFGAFCISDFFEMVLFIGHTALTCSHSLVMVASPADTWARARSCAVAPSSSWEKARSKWERLHMLKLHREDPSNGHAPPCWVGSHQDSCKGKVMDGSDPDDVEGTWWLWRWLKLQCRSTRPTRHRATAWHCRSLAWVLSIFYAHFDHLPWISPRIAVIWIAACQIGF